MVTEPVKAHVNSFGTVLLHSRVDDAVGRAVAGLDRSWRLLMAEFFKGGLHARKCSSLRTGVAFEILESL